MCKNYGQFKAVDSLSLNLFKDEIFCFLGHNGAGKTTSLKVLIGQEAPSKGTILINS
jgi:ABC-type multidrug transport system ATPase subunit